ncbi:MAG: TIGR03663 family protein [Chloroflexota bacterium]|nr:TIGR03663 family protein [Chloroflexota bacterium]
MSTQEPQIPYGGTTVDRLKAMTVNAETRERISVLASRYWEPATYALLVIFAAVLRFYNLGARAMHHDESLHGVYSYGFTKGVRDLFTLNQPVDTYRHVPFMHGPFQFIGNGFMMAVFGDGEYQVRMLAALTGTAMVFMPFLLRKQLGTIGALAAAAFIAFSPTLLYFSRFTREDIYAAFWTFGIVIFMWRYIATKQDRYLFLTAGFLAGSFCTKETTFMTAAAFIGFMDYLFAVHIADKIRAKTLDITPIMYTLLVLALLPGALLIAVAWPLIANWRKKYDLEEMPPEANLLIVLGTLSLPQYAAGVQLLPGFGKEWRNRAGDNSNSHIATQEFHVAIITILALIGVATAVGIRWRPKTWLIAAAAFWIPFVLLYTTFFSNMPGLLSGIWGSMDYWISQQDVRRGNQPDYYYFITIPVYEFLPLVITLAAGAYYAIRGKLRNALFVAGGLLAILVLLILPPGPDLQKVSLFHIILPFSLVLLGLFSFRMDAFNRFLLFWTVITAFALTVAGEKMPWLNVHIALPLAVVAGRFVGDMVENTDLRDDLPKLERLAPFVYAAIASALAILVFVIVGPFSFASVGGWILTVVAGVSVYWAYSGYSRKTAMQVAAVGAVAAFTVFSLRAGILASWGHPNPNPLLKGSVLAQRDYGDVPDELLVYTQTSGDIPVLRDKIDQYAKETGLGAQTPIVVDSSDGYSWPWAWYLRHYTAAQYPQIGPNYQPPLNAIVLASKTNAGNVQAGGLYDEPVPYHHRRWFPEQYRGDDGKYSTHDFFSDLFSLSELNKWREYWVERKPPAELGTVDGVAFFPKGFSSVPTVPVGPTVKTEGAQLVIGSSGSAPGQLNGPSDVAFDSSGNIYVADTNNNRIEKYSATGDYIAAAGGFSSADLLLNQPWSMTVAGDGTVFIADTWNHKIVKLGNDLKKVKEWGVGGQVEGGGDPLKLFGPREITLTAEGHLLVADTGNKRIIEYTQDGDPVRQFGSAGKSGDPLQFDEPVGVAVATNGDIYVADFWNQRIVHLDKDLKSKGEIKIPTWGSNSVADRAYMALLPDGRLLVTDPNPCSTAPSCPSPESGKVLVFDASGNAAGSYDLPKEPDNAFARPIGIASDGTSVLVADSSANVVRKIPLSEIVK